MKKEDPPENAVSRLDFSEDFSSDPSASVPEDRGDTGMAAISHAFMAGCKSPQAEKGIFSDELN